MPLVICFFGLCIILLLRLWIQLYWFFWFKKLSFKKIQKGVSSSFYIFYWFYFLPNMALGNFKLPEKKQNFVTDHHWVIFTIFAKNSSQIIIGSIFPPRVKKNTNNCKYLIAFCVSFEFVFLLLFVIMTTLSISSVLVVVVIYWLLHRDP